MCEPAEEPKEMDLKTLLNPMALAERVSHLEVEIKRLSKECRTQGELLKQIRKV